MPVVRVFGIKIRWKDSNNPVVGSIVPQSRNHSQRTIKNASLLGVENGGYLVNKLPAACLYFDQNACQIAGAKSAITRA